MMMQNLKKVALLGLTAFSSLCAVPDMMWDTSPTTLSTPGVDASEAFVLADVYGDVTAIWVESGSVKTKTLLFGGGWSSATSLSSSDSSAPRLSVDGSGNYTAIWLENGVVMTADFPNNGTWGSSSALSGSGSSSPTIREDLSGNTVAVWVRNGYIESSTRLSGGGWGAIDMLSSVGAEDNPALAIGGNNKVVAIWHTVVNGRDLIYYSDKTANGSWSTSATIFAAPPGYSHNFPKVVVDSSGNAYAAWLRYNYVGSMYVNTIVVSSTLIYGSSNWSAIPTQLSDIGQFRDSSQFSLNLMSDQYGDILAVWPYSSDGSYFSIQASSLATRGAWAGVQQVTVDNLASFRYGGSVNALGDAVVCIMLENNGGNIDIIVSESDISAVNGVFWTSPVTVSSGGNNAYPKSSNVLVGSVTYASLVWLNSNGTNNTVQYIQGSGAVLDPPTNVAVSQSSINYGVFTEYYNTVSWTASPAANVSGYAVYRNNVFFTFVDASQTNIVDYNAIQNGSVTYGVSAISYEQDQSPRATASFP